MWRAMFLAIGFFVMITGVECLGVDKVSLKIHEEPAPAGFLDPEQREGPAVQFIPPPWAPYSLLAVGAVVCLYSFTIPRRVAGG
jgi:hypothetical protein